MTVLDGTNVHFVMYAHKLDNYGRSQMKLLPENMGCFYSSFPFRINSPFVGVIDKAVFDFNELGFIQHWYKKFATSPKFNFMKNFYQQTETEINQLIDLSKIQGAFHILLLGHLLSLIVFCFEVLFNRIIDEK